MQKKVLLRDAYRGRLPDSILDGAKKGFRVPLTQWFRGPLLSQAREILGDPEAVSDGLLDPAATSDLIEAHASGAADRSDQIWAALMLELWRRTATSS